MNLLFGSTLQKIIAAILSIFMSATVVLPGTQPLPKNHVKDNTSVVVTAPETKEEDQLVTVPDAEVEAPAENKAPAKAETETPAEAEAPAETETPAETEAQAPAEAEAEKADEVVSGVDAAEAEAQAPAEAETPATEENVQNDPNAVETWDISENGDGSVEMHYYAADEEPSLLDAVTASIKSFILPMTAYAAELPTQEVDGTLVIEGDETGTGVTESMVFRNLLNADAFVPAYEAYCAENDMAGYEYILISNINEKGEFIGAEVSADEAHAAYADNTELLKNYFPCNFFAMVNAMPTFWEDYGRFVPKRLVINGNIDTISFGAFVFCTSIEEIVFNGTVKHIKDCAFYGAGIKNLTLPEGILTIGDRAFLECTKLTEIYLPAGVEAIGEYALAFLPEGVEIHCANDATSDLILEITKETRAVDANGTTIKVRNNIDEHAQVFVDGTLVYAPVIG